jgi:DNA polymerase
MKMLFLDIETRSECDLIFHGLRRYAEDPTTEIICMAYAFDDEPVQFWWGSDPFPEDVKDYIEAGGLITAHNADFDRTVIENVLCK